MDHENEELSMDDINRWLEECRREEEEYLASEAQKQEHEQSSIEFMCERASFILQPWKDPVYQPPQPCPPPPPLIRSGIRRRSRTPSAITTSNRLQQLEDLNRNLQRTISQQALEITRLHDQIFYLEEKVLKISKSIY